MSATWEIQKAIYSALSGNSTFMDAIGNRLYDEPPVNLAYPYTVIGDVTEISDNRLYETGFEDTITLHIYTKPGSLGFKEAKQILEKMNDVLNLKVFDLTSYTMLICKFENAMSFRDEDKRIISVRYRVIAN